MIGKDSSGMALDKENLWKALKSPTHRDCGNCKYSQIPMTDGGWGKPCKECIKNSGGGGLPMRPDWEWNGIR